MILTCPNCNSEYDILETALGEEGREVKCAKCAHLWFEAPEKTQDDIEDEITEESAPDELSEKDDQKERQEEDKDKEGNEQPVIEDITKESAADEMDIPESVKPITIDDDDEDLPPLTQNLQAKMAGYGVALIIFGVLIVSSFLYKNDIIEAWPPSALFYEMAGVPAMLEGEGLVVESLSATILKNKAQQDVLVVKGRVVNLTASAINVPKMQAVMRSTNGEGVEKWIIGSPVETVAAGESFAFTSDYVDVPKNIGSVNLAFIPTLKH